MDRFLCSQANRGRQNCKEDSHLGLLDVLSKEWLTFIEVGNEWLATSGSIEAVPAALGPCCAYQAVRNSEELRVI